MNFYHKHLFIVGSGAIGKALAVFLSQAGRKVTMIRGSVDDGRTTIRRFAVEMEKGVLHEADVEVATLNSLAEIDGIVVVATKSFGNEKLACTLKSKIGDSPLVLLQNGLGIEQPFLEHGYQHVYRCVLFVTSQSIDEVAVRFKPVATCPVGIEHGDKEQLNNIVAHLNTPNFGFKREVHIQHIVWKKAIINCVFNSVCPLLEIDNGIFHRNPGALKIARRVIAECTTIAHAKGIAMQPDDVERGLVQISRLSDGQAISTLQDIWRNKRTEIETLNAEIVRIAEQIHQQDAVRETRLLGELTKIKSERALKST
ncbi:2-dehydropantoate 2-reductase [Parapedobacter sp. ISTM3]|uniref:ketopantoate reductase family protein n=1 Tax=Parapedobacter sp. ISTM3 TaxID=2800130 RepID=UPI001904FD5C|nr:2-dehydropantoate 2-reductase [Parapedobacter sp. ISTM3]MBK1439628.1 2-dehydropantoate 2-reductase [Parapedobacter sp. ISTM3]